jgi:elongation factor Ts
MYQPSAISDLPAAAAATNPGWERTALSAMSGEGMPEITAAMVKQLRDATGAGMMECKAALTEANGNLDEATTILRKRGLAQATKKAGRSTNEGLIGSYVHMGGKIGVLVEINCESDFVARTEDFQNLAREIAMHVAAASPQYVRREEVPADVLEREKSIYRAQMEGQNKPPQVIEKIVEGKLGSFYEQVCLLDQPSIRDPKMTIAQIVQAAIAKLGENISIARFVRFNLGEGV